MFSQNLIQIADIQEFEDLSTNTNADKKVNPSIKRAQNFCIRPFLSDEFYLELLNQFFSSPEFPDTLYRDLWEGSTYMCGDLKLINPGLRSVHVYYSYANYLGYANSDSTAHGIMETMNQHSKPIAEATKIRLVSDASSSAKGYEDRVRRFLNNKEADYPLWDCGTTKGQTAGQMRITGVGGNSKRRY